MKVKIEKLAYGGFGIGFLDSKPCFVPYTLPEEEVKVKITKEKKDYNECEVIDIINPSKTRINPPCKYYTVCGGCDFQHTDYANQLKFKTEILKEQLLRIGKIKIDIDEVIPSESPFYYRNRVQFKFDGKNFGFYKRDSHQTVDIEECFLLKEDINQLIRPIKKFLIKYGLQPSNIQIFSNKKDEKIIKFTFSEDSQILNVIPKIEIINEEVSEDIKGVSFESGKNRIDLGQKFIFYQVNKYKFRVSIDSFFQVNLYQIPKLIEKVEEILNQKQPEKLLDFYCGVGTFSIPSGFYVKEVLGIEANESAVKDAKSNVGHNSLKNVKFLKAKAEKGIKYALDFKPDTVIFDPPRAGIGKEVINNISKIDRLKNVIYISCNPSTLARDINYFESNGFKLKSVSMIDMFPNTHHIESVSLLERE
ncbi:MAG: 23S rRNA (uracil(1939)-C(5))-methyltransferase RlmD [Hydrogenothermaceae bacterium]